MLIRILVLIGFLRVEFRGSIEHLKLSLLEQQMKLVEAMVMVLLGDKGDFGIVFVLSLSFLNVYNANLYKYF